MLHEFLSGSSWIDPQIDYLLFLQNIRLQYGGEGLFMGITKFGEFFISTVVMCIVYWCIDFKTGVYLFGINVFNLLFAQILKLSACVYRPWVLCDKVHPVEAAMRTASGYSFPSGHTAIGSVWAGLAFVFRKKPLISASFVILLLLIAFSRNYVGVHTPQDVIAALIVIVISLFVINSLINWCEKDRNRYLTALVWFDIAILAATVFVLFKNYPIDYLNGAVLVDPHKAVYGAILNGGWIAGLINGAFLCAAKFPFDTKNIGLKVKVMRVLCGIVPLIPLYIGLEEYIYQGDQPYVIAFFAPFIVAFFITGLYPMCFKFIKN